MREAELEEMEKKWREENERIMRCIPPTRIIPSRARPDEMPPIAMTAAERAAAADADELPPREAAAAVRDIDDTKQPLLEHLIELRRRLLWSSRRSSSRFFVCFYFAKDIFAVLVQPLLKAGQGKLIYTDIFEAFFVAGEGRAVRGADAQLSGDCDAAVAVRRARPLRQGKEGLPAVPAADSRFLRRRRLLRLFRRHALGAALPAELSGQCRRHPAGGAARASAII